MADITKYSTLEATNILCELYQQIIDSGGRGGGTPGSKWLSGEVDPDPASGNTNDWYLNIINYNAYKKVDSSTWDLMCNIKGAPGQNSSVVYSTTEVDTGDKWIDGKSIYRKVINLGALPNTAIKNVAHGITNISNILSIRGFGTGGGYYYPIPHISTGAASCISIYTDSTNITIQTGVDRSSITANITLIYTKTI